MVLQPSYFGQDDAQVFSSLGNFDPSQFFNTEGVGPVVRHRAEVLEPIGIRHRAEIAGVLADLFVIAMQVSEDRLELADDLAVERDVHPKHAMRGRMLRPHRNLHKLALEPGTHCRRWPLDRFEYLLAHTNGEGKKVKTVKLLKRSSH